MRHVLGMAKRCLDLKGAKRQKVELDFLRLAYTVRELRESGDEAQGYLLVLSGNIARCVADWIEKYKANDAVKVKAAELTREQATLIRSEVARNTAGMIAGTQGEEVGDQSDATNGGAIGEEYLRVWIEQDELGIHRNVNLVQFPLGIRWDYYGVR